jgi:hypothetical protein
MDITVTVYYNVGASLIKAKDMQDKLNEAAKVSGLLANELNWKHVLSHSYFHETFRATKRKAENFAKKARLIKGVDNVTVDIKD